MALPPRVAQYGLESRRADDEKEAVGADDDGRVADVEDDVFRWPIVLCGEKMRENLRQGPSGAVIAVPGVEFAKHLMASLYGLKSLEFKIKLGFRLQLLI